MCKFLSRQCNEKFLHNWLSRHLLYLEKWRPGSQTFRQKSHADFHKIPKNRSYENDRKFQRNISIHNLFLLKLDAVVLILSGNPCLLSSSLANFCDSIRRSSSNVVVDEKKAIDLKVCKETPCNETRHEKFF